MDRRRSSVSHCTNCPASQARHQAGDVGFGIPGIVLGVLPASDFDKFEPRPNRDHPHSLTCIAEETLRAWQPGARPQASVEERGALNDPLKAHQRRDAGVQDTFINPDRIESARMTRRLAAAIRLVDHELARSLAS